MGAGFQIQLGRVSHHLGAGHGGAPEIGHAGNDGRIGKPSVNLCPPILDLVGNDSMQKIDRTKTRGAHAVAGKRKAVGQAWYRGGAVRYHGGAT